MPLFAVLSALASTSGIAGGFQLFDVVSSGVAAASGALRVNTAAPLKSEERIGERQVIGVACIPDPTKANLPGGCGEDAYFISDDVTSFGVSDGVGGWRKHGVDSSAYSRCLMSNTEKLANAGDAAPERILQGAYDSCHHVTGSATAAVATLSPDFWLTGVNLGDSGWRVIRNGQVVLRTREQQWGFNAPNQLGTGSGDRPCDADRYSIQLRPNDVVVMGTDGLFDNLSNQQILKVYGSWDGNSAKRLAELLATTAHKIAADPNAVTPFATSSKGLFTGGKMDDISVVVSVVPPSTCTN